MTDFPDRFPDRPPEHPPMADTSAWPPPPPPPAPPAPPGWAPPASPPTPPAPPGWAPPSSPPPSGWWEPPPAPAAWPPPAAPSVTIWPTDTGWMGFDAGRPAPRWGMPDLLLGMVAFVVGGVVFSTGAYVVTADRGVLSIVGLLGSWVGALGYLLLISKVKGQGSLRLDFGLRLRPIDLLIGAGAAIVTLVASLIVRVIVSAAFNDKMGTNTENIFGPQTNKWGVLVLAVMATIGAPFVEELLFRGLALRSIERRFGGLAAVIASTVLFGILHYPGGSVGSALSLVAGIAVYGFVFAVVDRAVGRLGPSIVAHALLNGLAAVVTVYLAFTGQSIG